jgi:excisionase family DNA binding protein
MERMVVHGRPGEVEDIPPVLREDTEAEIKDWYSPDELWRWLGLGRTKTYELLRSGEIPSYKIGRVRRIRRQDIEAWLERNRSHSGNYRSQHNHLNLESWLPDATEDDVSLVS